jgi:hypothetical protein
VTDTIGPAASTSSPEFDPTLLAQAPAGRVRLVIHRGLRTGGHLDQERFERSLRFGYIDGCPPCHLAVIEAPDSSVVGDDGYTLILAREIRWMRACGLLPEGQSKPGLH